MTGSAWTFSTKPGDIATKNSKHKTRLRGVQASIDTRQSAESVEVRGPAAHRTSLRIAPRSPTQHPCYWLPSQHSNWRRNNPRAQREKQREWIRKGDPDAAHQSRLQAIKAGHARKADLDTQVSDSALSYRAFRLKNPRWATSSVKKEQQVGDAGHPAPPPRKGRSIARPPLPLASVRI